MLVDLLGHPIEKGMTVLTNGYYSAGNHIITKVIRVTKKAVIIQVQKYDWQNQLMVEKHELRRHPSTVFVIEKQIKYNQETFPEYQV